MAAQMETLNVMEKMRPLPFIVMFVVAAEFEILKESLEGMVVVRVCISCDHVSNPQERQEEGSVSLCGRTSYLQITAQFGVACETW